MPQPRPKKPKIITDDPRSHFKAPVFPEEPLINALRKRAKKLAPPEIRARIVVHDADEMTKKEIRFVATWLKDQAERILENDGKLAATYRATLYR